MIKPDLSFASPYIVKTWPVGSRVTCKPEPQDSDHDWLVLTVAAKRLLVVEAAEKNGFTLDGSLGGGTMAMDEVNGDEPRDLFASLKRPSDNVNLIITADDYFAQRFLAATSVAKRFNLLDKEDRIALFRAVLYVEEC